MVTIRSFDIPHNSDLQYRLVYEKLPLNMDNKF